jgi:hypothetical protein
MPTATNTDKSCFSNCLYACCHIIPLKEGVLERVRSDVNGIQHNSITAQIDPRDSQFRFIPDLHGSAKSCQAKVAESWSDRSLDLEQL